MTTQSTHPLNTITAIDPRDLLVDINVRRDLRIDADFLASVRDLGVLQPIVAVRTSEGDTRVRFGHRRTRAAIEVGLASVPVLVVADESSEDQARVERLVSQHAENTQRAGLSRAEEVGVVEQLSLLGVSAAQIATRTRLPRAHVTAALAVASSDLARQAAADFDFLDLTQSAALAEFEDDPETVTTLITAARQGRFDHALQLARDARHEREGRDVAEAVLWKQGLTVIDSPTYPASSKATWLHHLSDQDGQILTPQTHATCPGHVAYVHAGRQWSQNPGAPTHDQTLTQEPAPADSDQDDQYDEEEGCPSSTAWTLAFETRYACADPAAHGHRDRFTSGSGNAATTKIAEMDPAEADAARAARRDVIESNKAWRAATTVRREWLAKLRTRRATPKGSALIIAHTLVADPDLLTRPGARDLAADLLDCPRPQYARVNTLSADLVAGVSDTRAQIISLVTVLAGYEASLSEMSWRSVTPSTRTYLEHLASLGYVLAQVEHRACGHTSDPEPGADPTS